MRAKLLIIAFVFVGLASWALAADRTIVTAGKSSYVIVRPKDAIPSEQYAAEELQRFVAEMTGVTLPILDDSAPLASHEILLGKNRHLEALAVEIPWEELGQEGYVIRTVGNHVVIAGGRPRGTLYGVYGLLEEQWGCRWFAPGVSRIPKQATLLLSDIDQKVVPVLEYREAFLYEAFDGDWCARARLNSNAARLTEKHGGKVRFGRGYFVHTFDRLVPPEKYFDEHPEYFALVKGKRLRNRTQLCCTNEDVIRIVTDRILEAIKADPEAMVFSVSQNDWWNYCECPNCQKIAQREESQMGPVLYLVNRVAEEVEKHYPDKAIETLAYQWTRKPLLHMRPRKNVIIRLCSIECCFAHLLDRCDSEVNRKFCEDIKGWSKICNRLWVWNYVTDFRHYLLPFPNHLIRNDNIRFYVAHNVKGIFEQDTYNTAHSELWALGGYLTSKFLWDPDYDEQKAIDEFLEGYYSKAAPVVRHYIEMLNRYVTENNIHVNIWAGPNSPHLDDQLLVAADKLWQQAEQLVADDPAALERVRLSRMSVDYAILERARYLIKAGKFADSPLRSLVAARLEPYLTTLRRSGMTRLNEWKPLDFEAYSTGLRKDLAVLFQQ